MLHLSEFVNRKGSLDAASMTHLHALCERYPYYHAARIVYLRALHAAHDSSFSVELRRAALYVPSRETLYTLIEGDNLKPGSRPERKSAAQRDSTEDKANRTDSLLTDFLSTLPKEKKPRRKPSVADAATDYIGYMEQLHALEEEEKGGGQKTGSDTTPSLQHQDLIDVFLGSSGEGRIVLGERDEAEMERPNLTPDDDQPGGTCTETLAHIYIKQGKYDKAKEIISKLAAKYPRKNRYFADQLRFLDKLILNNNNK